MRIEADALRDVLPEPRNTEALPEVERSRAIFMGQGSGDLGLEPRGIVRLDEMTRPEETDSAERCQPGCGLVLGKQLCDLHVFEVERSQISSGKQRFTYGDSRSPGFAVVVERVRDVGRGFGMGSGQRRYVG